MDDQTPELDGASETAVDLELAPEGTGETSDSKEPSGDPLDDIKDPVARDEAKKYRAIARRDKPEVKKEAPSPEYVTKQDFFKANEKKAVREAIADPEVKAHWEEIKLLYTSRRGKETPEDIGEDIKDAIILFNARNPVTETDESARELTTTPVVKTGGTPPSKHIQKSPDLPNFKTSTSPKDWYPVKK